MKAWVLPAACLAASRFGPVAFPIVPRERFSGWSVIHVTAHGGSAMAASKIKFHSAEVLGDLYLGIAIAGVNTLLVIGMTLAFLLL
jgi:hypothetical protein